MIPPIFSKSSILFQRPLKKFPKTIIFSSPKPLEYYSKINNSNMKMTSYKMYDTELGEVVAYMRSGPVSVKSEDLKLYDLPKGYMSYYINFLFARARSRGYGKAFLNFAKIMSKKTGCEGRLHLNAGEINPLAGPPHLFYKSQGLVARTKATDDLLNDAFIKHKRLTEDDVHSELMYLPIDKIK